MRRGDPRLVGCVVTHSSGIPFHLIADSRKAYGMMFAVLLVCSLLAWHGVTLIYCVAMLTTGLLLGAHAEALSVGFGPVLCSWTWHGIDYRFSWIPTGGYVKFKGRDDEDDTLVPSTEEFDQALRPTAFQDLSPLYRLLILASGPASNLLTGMLIAMVAMQFPESDLRILPDHSSNLAVTGVPHLVSTKQPASFETYVHLTTVGILPFFVRMLTFQSVSGWSGFIGMIVTCAAAGTMSPGAWGTCIAMLFIANGVMNCFPIPTLNGWTITCNVIEILIGRKLPDEPPFLFMFGFAWLLVVLARFCLNDVFWGLSIV